MLTGWEFARSGKKATEFGLVCRALGVQFDFNLSKDLVLLVGNTESRRSEILALIGDALERGLLDKSGCLTLRGKLGFADSFMHGRLGAILLKKLSEHAYGRTSKLDDDARQALSAMAKRLEFGEPWESWRSGLSSLMLPTSPRQRLVGLVEYSSIPQGVL